MKLEKFRERELQHDKEHPELPNCIYYNCTHKIKPAWDNKVLCGEHELMMLFWFYEEDGAKYCPDVWDMNTGKKLPKPKGSVENMAAYRKKYCDWIAALSEKQYLDLLKFQIGDDEKGEVDG